MIEQQSPEGGAPFIIFDGVEIGKGAIIEPGVIIGTPPFGRKNGELKTIIGKNAYIRAYTIIYAGVVIGNSFQTGPHVFIREGNKIGSDVQVWCGSVLNPGNIIRRNSKIHAGVFMEMATLGVGVFIGPKTVFTDDPHPVMPPDYRECWKGATIGNGAIVGANVTLLPHVRIGTHAVIGAGSVVTKNIPAYKVAVGNPARVIKDIEDVACRVSGITHKPYVNLRK